METCDPGESSDLAMAVLHALGELSQFSESGLVIVRRKDDSRELGNPVGRRKSIFEASQFILWSGVDLPVRTAVVFAA